MAKFKKKISLNKINVAKISSGTMLGQIISIISLPIITRLYGVEAIGFWALINSSAMIVKSFSDLGMSHSLMLEKKNEILQTYKVITTLVGFFSILSSIIVTLFLLKFSSVTINPYFLLIFLFIIIFTTQQVQVSYTWLNRIGEYNVLMKNPLINNGIYALVAIVLGLLGFGIYGYLIGHCIGQISTLIHMKKNLPKSLFTFNFSDFKYVLIKNNRFVKFQLPTNILSNFKNQLPILLIEFLWGTTILGYYSITVKLLQIPISLIANAIGRVFFQTIAIRKKEGKDLGVYVCRNLKRGMFIAAIPILLLTAFGDIIVLIFLGEEWRIAGYFIQILAIQFFFMFVMNTVQGISTVLEKQNLAMISSLLQVFGFIVGALIGTLLYENIYLALIFMSVFYITFHIIYLSRLLYIMKLSRFLYIKYSFISVSIILISAVFFRFIFNKLVEVFNFSMFGLLLI
ncbi:oligosaccharide flippase family protein [Planococcus sp. MERTA32b]|nr:oligosaccharide flippase family protein [Planococcus sp. MER TA 32b]